MGIALLLPLLSWCKTPPKWVIPAGQDWLMGNRLSLLPSLYQVLTQWLPSVPKGTKVSLQCSPSPLTPHQVNSCPVSPVHFKHQEAFSDCWICPQSPLSARGIGQSGAHWGQEFPSAEPSRDWTGSQYRPLNPALSLPQIPMYLQSFILPIKKLYALLLSRNWSFFRQYNGDDYNYIVALFTVLATVHVLPKLLLAWGEPPAVNIASVLTKVCWKIRPG